MNFTFKFLIALEFCLTFIIVQIFGELFVLHHGSTNFQYYDNITCISEEDNTALIWNTDRNSDNYNFSDFQPQRSSKKYDQNCAVWNSTRCSANWENANNWNVVNSTTTYMGPVLDYRWEGFDEFVFTDPIDRVDYQYVEKLSESADDTYAVSFSVRGSDNAHVVICNENSTVNNYCIWVIIAGWSGGATKIRYCDTGPSPGRQYPAKGSCVDTAVTKHDPDVIINAEEWRTFVLKWSNENNIIQLFRKAETQNEITHFVSGETKRRNSVFHTFVRSDEGTRVRFHFYDYYATKVKNSIMSTNSFEHNDKNLCIELLFGLCEKCKIDIDLVDSEEIETIKLKTITGGANSTMSNGTIISWSSLKLNIDKKIDASLIKLKIQTILDDDNIEGKWAVDNIRLCQSDDNLRKSSRLVVGNCTKINCQKLSYYKTELLKASTQNMMNKTESIKLINELKNSCGSSCENSGTRTSFFCNSIGCVCGRGRMGNDCSQECSTGFYGYNCNDVCSCCKDDNCNKIDGTCRRSNRVTSRSPPFCDLDLVRPTVTNITDTSIKILQTLNLDGMVDAIARIVIQKNTNSSAKTTADLKKSNTSSIYEAEVGNLDINTKYSVKTIVSVTGREKHSYLTSDSAYFITTCLGEQLFTLKPGDKNMTINLRNETETCENFANGNYSQKIREVNGTESESQNYPFVFTKLKPYTEYEVAIFEHELRQGESVSYILTSRTLESAPSKVEEFKTVFKNSTAVKLTWKSPIEKNGIIRNYDISIKLIDLLGCSNDTNKKTPDMQFRISESKFTFNGLHPYADYKATITARTTMPGEPDEIFFSTDQTPISTSVFSNLTIDVNKTRLQWKKPSDCTTVAGRTNVARLIFKGVSDWVKDWKYVDETEFLDFALAKLNLLPFTEYEVIIYIIRDYGSDPNPNKFVNLTWTTLPTAPPPVKDLLIYDADYNESEVSLQWTPPYPSNGIIKSYTVSVMEENKLLVGAIVPSNNSNCKSSGNFVCLKHFSYPRTIKNSEIKIYAMNEDVKFLGEMATFKITSDVYKKEPSEPMNFELFSKPHGIMSLKWVQPSSSRTKVLLYHIKIEILSTNLDKTTNNITNPTIEEQCIALKNQSEYFLDVRVLPSTMYNVTISSSNSLNINSTKLNKTVSIEGSVGFVKNDNNNDDNIEIRQVGALLEIKSIKVSNATINTTVSIIVNGLTTCAEKDRNNNNDNSTKVSSPEKKQWVAAVYRVDEIRDGPFTIGANHHHGVDTDCSFYVGEDYDIILSAEDLYSGLLANSTKSKITLIAIDEDSTNTGLFWLVILPIIASCLVFAFVKYRNGGKLPSDMEDLVRPTTPMSFNGLMSMENYSSTAHPGASESRTGEQKEEGSEIR